MTIKKSSTQTGHVLVRVFSNNENADGCEAAILDLTNQNFLKKLFELRKSYDQIKETTADSLYSIRVFGGIAQWLNTHYWGDALGLEWGDEEGLLEEINETQEGVDIEPYEFEHDIRTECEIYEVSSRGVKFTAIVKHSDIRIDTPHLPWAFLEGFLKE